MFGIWRITPARRRRLIRPTRAGLVKPHGQVGFGACLEYAIDHHAVEMEVRINRGLTCAVPRRGLSVGTNPTRQLSLQPIATRAIVEVTKRLKPLV